MTVARQTLEALLGAASAHRDTRGSGWSRVALAFVAGSALLTAVGLLIAERAEASQFILERSTFFGVSGAILGGLLLGFVVYRGLIALRGRLEEQTHTLLEKSELQAHLSNSIAEDIGELLQLCHSADQRLLAASMAMMVTEYDRAAESGDRQKALMNASLLLEKLTERLSPWYVRQAKSIALAVTVVGGASGVAKVLLPLFRTGR